MGDQAKSEDRPGYWFPLALLGFGLLAILGWNSLRTVRDFGWFAYALPANDDVYYGAELYQNTYPETSMNSVVVAQFDTGPFPMRNFPWALLVITTLVATVAWYGWRARRAGGSVRAYVLLAVGGVIAVLAAYCATGLASSIGLGTSIGLDGSTPDPAGLVTSVGLPLTGLGLLAGAWAYLRLGPWRRAAAVISVGCLMIGVGTVLGALAPGLLDPVLIAAGLLVLARIERSRLLAIVAVLVLTAMVAFPSDPMSMLAPAVVVLAAAMAILVRQGGASRPTAD